MKYIFLSVTAIFASLLLTSAPAIAQDGADAGGKPALDLSAELSLDGVAVVSGGDRTGTRQVSVLTHSADADLEQSFGWRGVTAHADVLLNVGQEPNDLVGSVQGVNNVAAGNRDVRLFQAWLEASIGAANNFRIGLTDLNSEFDASDSAGLLVGPSYGIGPEFSATGPVGPSIYPSTALGARWRFKPSEATYLQAAVFNAQAGVPGDRGGVDFSSDEGLLVVGEAGWTGRGKFGVGAWSYTERRDDIRDLTPAGNPRLRRSQGAYVLGETSLAKNVTAFVKAGVSDGRTTDVAASWQTGALIGPVFAGRAESQFSVGVAQARFASRARANAADLGLSMGRAETQFELTYSDKLVEHIAFQPDVQYIVRTYGRKDVKNALVVGARLVAGF